MIRQTLQQIGLTEGEAEVYEALVELGLSSTGKITKKAHIASSKVYEVLDRLMQKGLASYVLKNGVHYYDATPPERLLDFLEDKKNGIIKSQDIIKRIIPQINYKREAAYEINKTIVYTGMHGPKIVLKESIEIGRKANEPLYGFGTDVDDYLTYFPLELKRHFEEQKNIKYFGNLFFQKALCRLTLWQRYDIYLKDLPYQFEP